MRQLAIIALLLPPTGSSPAAAQTPVTTGVWLVGGNARVVGFRDLGNDAGERGAEISPQIGYFIMTGLAVSANAIASWSSRDRSGSNRQLGVGPGVSYFVSGISDRLFPYAAIRTLRTWSKFRSSSDAPLPVAVDGVQWTWTAAAGAALFLARNAAVTGELFYSRFSVADVVNDGEPVDQRNSSKLFGLQFGFRIFAY